MQLIDFNQFPKNLRRYGGLAGNKFGIKWNNENWLIKFPKNTRYFKNPKVSYTTSPLSEYLGSKVYESLGIPTHEVFLGFRKSENSSTNKIVVACKDFRLPNEQLIEFKDIKNAQFFSDGSEGSGGSGTVLSEVLETIQLSSDFEGIRQEVSERFWDMFVVDFLIGNNDRNNGNWGLLATEERIIGLTPVYDNGNAFYNKRPKETFQSRLENEKFIETDALDVLSVYVTDEGHHIKAPNLISSMAYPDCNEAILRFFKRYDNQKINELFAEIPEYSNSLAVFPREQKEYLLSVMSERVRLVLMPTYEKLQNSMCKD